MNETLKTTVRRRGFLASASVAGAAGVAAVAIPAINTSNPLKTASTETPSKGYQLTERVKQYYRTTTV